MIPNRLRGSRRTKSAKLPKNLKRLFIEGKCRECAVVVTRMDFAKILGKFTKVKIQFESSTTPKTIQNSVTSPKHNSRLKTNENGMVQIRRNAYNEHPVKELTSTKKITVKELTSTKTESPRLTPNILKENNRLKKPILKDKTSNNNNCTNLKQKNNLHLKEYGIVFQDPLVQVHNVYDVNSKISLNDLISQINDNILPSEDWCIDFFPKKGEPKDDKVYDRIAAELEDLMYSEKPKSNEKSSVIDAKVDEFPSIMDILNDNTRDIKPSDQNSCLEFKSNLESSDVEAMLLGKSDPISDPIPPTPMAVDDSEVRNLIEDVSQLTGNQDTVIPEATDKLPLMDIKPEEIENPQSPSILDEALQKGIEEHLPCNSVKLSEHSMFINEEVKQKSDEQSTSSKDDLKVTSDEQATLIKEDVNIKSNEPTTLIKEDMNGKSDEQSILIKEDAKVKSDDESTILTENIKDKSDENSGLLKEPAENLVTKVEDIETKIIEKVVGKPADEPKETKNKQTCPLSSIEGITHLVFKKNKDGICFKTVTCPKNLKYEIEINGKSVEFLGAPKVISSLEDLQVLLQIVNESELDSLYVLH